MTLTSFCRLLLEDRDYQDAQRLLSLLHSRQVSAYDDLSDSIKIVAPVYSAAEYADFIEEGSDIRDELFLLGYLAAHSQCLEIGAFDEDFCETVAAFAARCTGITLENSDAFDADQPELFFEALRVALRPSLYSLLVFASEDFYEQFFLFLVSTDILRGETVASEYRITLD